MHGLFWTSLCELVRSGRAPESRGYGGRTDPSREPLFPIRGPATASWREHALARAAEYRLLAHYLLKTTEERDQFALDAIERHLEAAERAAEGGRADPGAGSGGESNGATTERRLGRWARLMSFLGGASIERANSHLDAVEADLLRLADDPYLRSAMPGLVAHVRAHLPAHDPRRQRVEEVAWTVAQRPDEKLTDLERWQVIGAVRGASLEARLEIRRVRSFRNILVVSALALCIGVAGITLLGVLKEEIIPLCFVPDRHTVVCPTSTDRVPGGAGDGQIETADAAAAQARAADRQMRKTASPWDVPIVEIVGLLAAALAAAFAVRSIQGTSTPYSLPVAVAVLKLPAGALTAVLGLLLMRGGFIPGLSALDTSAQIVAWAVVFGYSQQLLTHFVDEQARAVLDKVGGAGNPQLGTPAGPTGPPPAPPSPVEERCGGH
jgi:hypothetical protein